MSAGTIIGFEGITGISAGRNLRLRNDTGSRAALFSIDSLRYEKLDPSTRLLAIESSCRNLTATDLGIPE
jgi:hypothetical protein